MSSSKMSKGTRIIDSIIKIQQTVRCCLSKLQVRKLKDLQRHELKVAQSIKYLGDNLPKSKPKKQPSIMMRKPPIYKKTPKSQDEYAKSIIIIQKHIRGFLQRKKFKNLLIEKMLKEQEDQYETQIKKVEDALIGDEFYSNAQSPDLSEISIMNQSVDKSVIPSLRQLDKVSKFELPLPMSQRKKFSPSKNKKLVQPIVFDFDIYILAATEIQRVYRGHLVRKNLCGNFYRLRSRIKKIQHLYKNWKKRRSGQLELAIKLLSKHSNMMTTTFGSYQHLRSIVLNQDKNGKYSKVLESLDMKMRDVGLFNDRENSRNLQRKIIELEKEKREEKARHTKELEILKLRERNLIDDYMKGMKALKYQLEISHKNNFELFGKLFKRLQDAKKEADEDYNEPSTLLPENSL
ncbi:unnamed protein product [Blepharisma stoltei]|uniref:Uncharacterized protein n=1 Tax=Blepharisma stoltei TaxID=1481888 RepID=A0AAU9JMG0_9CILI|nr:unnamed protein product [Blepharisma stoltei]